MLAVARIADVLQRGRARAGAELTPDSARGVGHSPASTGPRPRGRGIHAVKAPRLAAFAVASTGPRPRGRGINSDRISFSHRLSMLQRGRARAGAELRLLLHSS